LLTFCSLAVNAAVKSLEKIFCQVKFYRGPFLAHDISSGGLVCMNWVEAASSNSFAQMAFFV